MKRRVSRSSWAALCVFVHVRAAVGMHFFGRTKPIRCLFTITSKKMTKPIFRALRDIRRCGFLGCVGHKRASPFDLSGRTGVRISGKFLARVPVSGSESGLLARASYAHRGRATPTEGELRPPRASFARLGRTTPTEGERRSPALTKCQRGRRRACAPRLPNAWANVQTPGASCARRRVQGDPRGPGGPPHILKYS